MRKNWKEILAVSLVVSMIPGTMPTLAETVALTTEKVPTEVSADSLLGTPSGAALKEIPQGTLVLNGLFDVKSLEAGTSKYLYINTYPEEGTAITAVESDDPGVVRVSHGNNSAEMGADDTSGTNSNYNYVKLDAISEGNAAVTVTVEKSGGGLEPVTRTFDVQVIEPEYAGTQRVVTDISDDWKFKLERDMDSAPSAGTVPDMGGIWDDVTIPHCWNVDDGANGGNDYHKGIGWYVKEFSAEELSAESYGGKQLYLEMGAACKISEIYVNGDHVARHEGGYSRIRVDLTGHLIPGQANTIAISVDNRVNNLTPMSGDFTVFGGLYRDISLIATGDLHMDLDQETSFGGRGLYVSQQGTEGITKDTTVDDVFGGGGKLNVVGEVKNSSDETKTVSATAEVYDDNWNPVESYDFTPVEVPAGEVHQFAGNLVVDDPVLWDGTKNPYQYNVVFEVKDADGTVVDRERDRIGFRFYCADPEEGFFLNGESYPLRGVNSHQDRFNRGYAATHQDREQDMAIMEEMGANTIRFAHYQHDPYVYELASERGITVWTEIPMVNSIRNTWAFYESTENNLKELIHQAYNCPSVLMWGIHNEQWPNNSGITVLLDKLYKTCKAEDPSRLVTVATAQDPGDNVDDIKWDAIPLSWQSDVSAWNKYFGIYQGKDARYFGNWVNQVHAYGAKHKTIYGTAESIKNPDNVSQDIPVKVHGNVGMSEYGADGSPFIHEERPGYSAGSQSEEFVSQWHEIYYKAIAEADWMWGSYIWNAFEFGSDSRTTTPDRLGINTKGIVTYDRTIKKDPFYFYKANWSDTPTLQITSERFKERYQDDISVKVYSNMESVELIVNGISQGTLVANGNTDPALDNNGNPDDTLIPNTQMGKFVWDVKLKAGDNTVVAVGTDAEGNTYTDTVTWIRKQYGIAEIASSRYNVNTASHTISGIPGGTTVEEMMANIRSVKNSTFAPYTAGDELIEDMGTVVRLGMKVKVTAEDGTTQADYVIASAPISEGKTAKANAEQSGGSYPAKNAVDGNTATRWGSGGSFPGWIQIDLGQAYTLTNLDTLWYASSGRKYNFDVQVSLDGTNYTTVIQAADSEQGAAEPTWTAREFPDDTIARYLKLNVLKGTGSPSIYEIQAIGFGLNSQTLSVDNAERTIAGVDPEMTVEELLNSLSVEGDYNSLTAEQNGETVTGGTVTLDTTVVVGYGEDKAAAYTLLTDGPDLLPISQGKKATAQDITVGGRTFPNEDSGEGCSLDRDSDVASNINDGDLTTRWTGALTESGHTIPSNAYPADVIIDLEGEYVLNKLFMSNFDPKSRIYKFVVYAGNDPETLKAEENIILDMRNNINFGNGTKDVSGSGRYILLSVTGNTAPSSYRAASVYEMKVYGYRFEGEEYAVDLETKTISGVTVQTTVADFLKTLDIGGNYTAEVVLGNRVLDENSMITEGAELRISDLDGENPVTFAITFDEALSDNPVSQGMPVHAHDVVTDHGTVPNEDAAKGDYADRINDGDDSTRWTGAFDTAHMKCYFPAAVTVDMTDPKSTDDYYYLTGVKIHFYAGSDNRYYGYNISASNIVGIQTGFVVDAADNKTPGWVEHWTEDGTNEIKDLTLNVQKCSNKASYAAAGVHELQIYAWRIKGHDIPIDEGNKTITIGTEPITVAELRSKLEILGNCTVKFVDADGSELGWNDSFTSGCKLVVTDVKDHIFEYTAQNAPVEDEYYTTSIEVKKQPNKLVYAVGEAFDPEGMEVSAIQKASPSNAERTIEIDPDELKYDYDFSEAGEKAVTVTYTGQNESQEETVFTAEVKVTVEDEIPDDDKFYYTTSIKVKKQPDKREYALNEAFDPKGMEVSALQTASPSNAERTVTVDPDELDYEYDFSEVGEQTVTVTYTGLNEYQEEEAFTTEVKVLVEDEIPDEDEDKFYYTTSIKIKKQPDKLEYVVDGEFDPKGMEVAALQKASPSNAARTVTVDPDELDYDYDFSEVGEKTVTVSYTGLNESQEEEAFTAKVKVMVKEEIPDEEEKFYYTTSISVNKKPNKQTYQIGEEFDPEGMKVSVKMKEYPTNLTKTVQADLDELDFEYDFTTAGKKKVRVVYYGMDKNQEDKRFTDELTVTVKKSASHNGSSSSGGGSATQTYDSLPKGYQGGTKVINNVRVPDYTVEGTWTKGEDGKWQLRDANGVAYKNAWAAVFSPSADVRKGQSAFNWFLFDKDGNMVTGWYTDVSGNTFYLNPAEGRTQGAMMVGWVFIDGKYYYFNEAPDGTRGKLLRDTTTPDGHYVDKDGVWVQK